MTEDLLDPNLAAPPQEPKSYYEELVGPNGKFKDNESLARGKWESDNYIKILETRLDNAIADARSLREDNQTKANLQELIDQFKSAQMTQPSSTQPENTNVTQPPSLEQLESLVDQRFERNKTAERESANWKTVQNKLTEKFGPNYQAALKKQIDDLDLTVDFANNLARSNPKVFFKTFGLDEQAPRETFQAPPRSNLRSDSFAPQAPQKRTWSYYQELFKKDPNAYYDKKIAVQMHNDAIALGADFQDGDFQRYGA